MERLRAYLFTPRTNVARRACTPWRLRRDDADETTLVSWKNASLWRFVIA
jgi:hypothetical protein